MTLEIALLGPAPEILVVDDNRDFRMFFSESLRERGYSVAQCNDGAEALVMLERWPGVRLIFLDMRLPVMDGRAFVARLARLHPERTLAIVVLTGAPETAKDLPVAEVLAKPVSERELLEIARRYCSDSGVSDSARMKGATALGPPDGSA